MKTAFITFLLGLFCTAAFAAPDAAATDPLQTIRGALIRQALAGDESRLKQQTPADPSLVKKIAPARLGTNLAKYAPKITGADFDIEPPAEQPAYIGVWIFSYRTHKAALLDEQNIKAFCQGNHFKAKVLTHFSSTVVANKIIVAFTENPFNQSAVNFVNSVPGLLAKNS